MLLAVHTILTFSYLHSSMLYLQHSRSKSTYVVVETLKFTLYPHLLVMKDSAGIFMNRPGPFSTNASPLDDLGHERVST